MNKLFYKFIFLICSMAPMSCLAQQKTNIPPFGGKKLVDLCSRIIRAQPNYFLVDAHGNITNGSINLGDVTNENIDLSTDTVLIDTKHRLVVNNKYPVSFIAPDFKLIKTKPTCPKTNEFRLYYATSTKSARVGVQNIQLNISVDIANVDASIDRSINFFANVLSPTINLEQSESLTSNATSFFQGKQNEFILKFKNVGTAPLVISSIEKVSKSSKWYSIDYTSCRNPSVQPQETCNVVFNRLTEPETNSNSTDIFEIQSNYKIGYPNFAIIWSLKESSVEFSRY